VTGAELSALMAGRSPHADANGQLAALAIPAVRAMGFTDVRALDETDDVVLKPYEKGREAMEAYLKWEVDLDPAALDAARSK
jgi:hypothetical protein